MKQLKISLIFIISALILATTSCNLNCVDADGPVITDSRVLEDFSRIIVSIPANVKLVVGGEPGITITAPESYINAISSNVSRKNLKIEGDVCNAYDDEINIEITVPMIDRVVVSGSANVFSDTPIRSKDLDLQTNGSGSISLSIFTNDVSAGINGSGNIILNGTCDDLDININGSGDFKGLGLNSFKVRVKINGSGNASVVAHNKLNATVRGSGHINYSGDPEISISISGSGNINKIN